jgi:hypothetical protein
MHRTTDLWGWLLFLLSAATFVIVGFRDGDVLLMIASLLFLAACVLFLLPYFHRK